MTQSALPAWIQALAAIAVLCVTWRLARLTRDYVRVTEDIATASKTQVQHALDLARGNQLSVARALLEETLRIRSELGEQPEDRLPVRTGSGVAVPKLLSWIEPIIPAIAQTDAEVVGLFMRLDRALANHRLAMTALHEREFALGEADDAHSRAEETDAQPAKHLALAIEKALTDVFAAKQRLNVARHNYDQAMTSAKVTYKHCQDTLDAIQARLRQLDRVTPAAPDRVAGSTPEKHGAA